MAELKLSLPTSQPVGSPKGVSSRELWGFKPMFNESQCVRYRGGDFSGVVSPVLHLPLHHPPHVPESRLSAAAGHHFSSVCVHSSAVIPLCPLCVLTAGSALYVFRKCL